jgi:hypothetical protein
MFSGQNFVFASESHVTKLTGADDDISWTPAIMRDHKPLKNCVWQHIKKRIQPTVVLDKGG